MTLYETCSEVHIDKCLKHFCIKNGLKQGDTLLQLLFKFTLECAIRWVKGKWEGLKFNFIHQFQVYADDVNLLVKVYVLYRKTQQLQRSLVRRLVKK